MATTWQSTANLKGPAGTPGSQTFFGTGTPASTLGIPGDVFFAQDTNRLYQKTSSGWPSQGNLLQGAMGLTGVNGSSFYSGPGAPTMGANEGDLYLNLTGGEIFKYTSGSWTDEGYSIKGDKGDIGVTGAQGLSLQTGNGSPTPDIGSVGDMYLDLVASVLYGPKTTSGWSSSGKSIVGAVGAQGTPGVRGSITFTGHGPPTDGQFADALGQDFYLDLDSGLLYANTSSGVQAGTAAFPPAILLSDVGNFCYIGSVTAGDNKTFTFGAVSGGKPFAFTMPFAGWVVGISFTGSCNRPVRIGAYIERTNAVDNTQDDAAYVQAINQPLTQLATGTSAFISGPPRFEAGDLASVIMEISTDSPSTDVSVFGVLHVQYDPLSVTAIAPLQAPGAGANSHVPQNNQ